MTGRGRSRHRLRPVRSLRVLRGPPLLAAVFAVGALLAAAPSGARAAAPAPGRTETLSPADSAARAAQPRTAPYKVMLRSAIVPGWGQLYNHQPLKAALVVGGEGFLVVSALRELKLQEDAIQRMADADAYGDSLASARAAADADAHRNRKITWIWWEVAAHLLSMADAYVDAHLATFEADFGHSAVDRVPGLPEADPVVALAIRVRF